MNGRARVAWSLARYAVAGIALAVITAVSLQPAVALHSIPPRLMFWDADRNHFADLYPEPLRAGGDGWTNDRRTRASEAILHWNNQTDYNTRSENAHSNYIIIDRGPWCNGGVFAPGTVGQTCQLAGNNGSYDDMYDADIYLSVLTCSTCTWWAGANQGPSNTYDFRGFLTHEIGHTVYLDDIQSDPACEHESAYPSMCGQFGPDPPYPPSFNLNDSYWYRSLHSDDISAANEVYRQVYR